MRDQLRRLEDLQRHDARIQELEAMVAALRGLDIDGLENDARAFRQIEGGTMAAAMLKVFERKYHAARKAAA